MKNLHSEMGEKMAETISDIDKNSSDKIIEFPVIDEGLLDYRVEQPLSGNDPKIPDLPTVAVTRHNIEPDPEVIEKIIPKPLKDAGLTEHEGPSKWTDPAPARPAPKTPLKKLWDKIFGR